MLTCRDFPTTPFTPADLRGQGVSRKALDEAVRNGDVRRVVRGAYLRSDVPDTIETRVRAAKLVISDQAIVCDRTAAWIHGVDVFAWHEHEVLPPLETFVLRHYEPARLLGVSGGTRDLVPDDVMCLDGLWVTTPLRTAVDLACKLSPRDGLAALDTFMREFCLSRDDMRRLLVRYFRRRGVRRARPLVAMADPRSESAGESWVRYEIVSRGITTPQPQWWVEIDGVPTYRLDLAYPKHRIAVEYDGQEHHSDAKDREHDEKRRAWLRQHGWIVIVVDRDRLTAAAVDEWIRELRQALQSRNFRPSQR
jgi:hypothetical protein